MSFDEIIGWAPLAAFAVLLVAAAFVDVRRRKIPNWTVLGLIVTYLAALPFGAAPTPWVSALAAAAIAFAVTYPLYHFGVIGAGDAKLFLAAALFAGLGHLLLLACLTMVAGGALAVGSIVLRPKQVMRGLTRRGRSEQGGAGIPYGVAIAIGGIGMATFAVWPNLPTS